LYITDKKALGELVKRLRSGELVGIDTEFMRERT
jgi:ribonuclease D